MSRIITASLALVLAVACSNESATPEAKPEVEAPKVEAPKAETPAQPAGEASADAFNAEATFKTVCGPCHGEKGAGDGAAAAALDPKPANFNEASFWETRDNAHVQKVIKLGGAAVGKSAAMAPFGGQFSDEEIAQLATYVEDNFKPKAE